MTRLKRTGAPALAAMDGSHLRLHNSNMTHPALPTYALYGEAGRSTGTDWLHCESIAARSQLHEWEIRPHRHEDLFQILYIARGQAELQLEGAEARARGPFVLTVPPLVAHGFRFEPGIEGWVFTVLDAHLQQLLAGEPALRQGLERPRAAALASSGAAAVARAAADLQREFADRGAWRALAVDAALLRLVVALARALPAEGAPQPGPGRGPERALRHVQRFRALVDERFRQQPALAAFAAELGITPTQLNRVCHQVLGHAALGVLHQRLLLEAQRELAYTTLSVKQIAHDLGFADAGYFTRFFQRLAGATPTAWRARRT